MTFRFILPLVILIVVVAASKLPFSDKPKFGFSPINHIRFPSENQEPEDLNSKVIGGSDASPGEIPFQVSLQGFNFVGGRYHSCGGSIINHFHVLTAGHCAHNMNLRNMEVVAGVNNIFTGSNNEQRSEIASATIHPTYNPDSYDGDVAVIKLKTPLEYNTFVQPIRLAPQDIEPSGKCLTSGWGNTANNGSIVLPGVLQKLELNIVPREECKENFGSIITKGMICAGGREGGFGSCNGDSGGPLICKDSNGVDYLAGDVSWGTVPCALPNYPSVYGNIAYYADWIEEIISD